MSTITRKSISMLVVVSLLLTIVIALEVRDEVASTQINDRNSVTCYSGGNIIFSRELTVEPSTGIQNDVVYLNYPSGERVILTGDCVVRYHSSE